MPFQAPSTISTAEPRSMIIVEPPRLCRHVLLCQYTLKCSALSNLGIFICTAASVLCSRV